MPEVQPEVAQPVNTAEQQIEFAEEESSEDEGMNLNHHEESLDRIDGLNHIRLNMASERNPRQQESSIVDRVDALERHMQTLINEVRDTNRHLRDLTETRERFSGARFNPRASYRRRVITTTL